MNMIRQLGAGLGIFLAVCCVPAAASTQALAPVTAASQAMQVVLDTAGRLEITNLHTGQRFTSVTASTKIPEMQSIEQDGPQAIHAIATTPAGSIDIRIKVAGAEAMVSVAPRERGQPNNLVWPMLWQSPSAKAELVLPTDEGVLLPATSVDIPRLIGSYKYGQTGIAMPWFGFVEGEQGLMALIETADDMQVVVGRTNAKQSSGPSLLTAGVEWLSSRDDLRYTRQIRFCLIERGGYVAMAKRYRKHLVDSGQFRTLADKIKELPVVERLLGAIDIYDHSAKRSATAGSDVLDWMINNGIRRALYYGGTNKDRNEKARQAGYVTARYDIYTDIATPELAAVWGLPKTPNDPRRIGYPDEAIVRRDGSLQPGFASPVGKVTQGGELKTIRCVNRCSAIKLDWLKRIVPRQAEEYALMSRFLDVETASSLAECYSPKHPETRTDDRRARTALFDYLRSIGQIAASEGGADWPAHALHYQEGSLTLNHLGSLRGVYIGTSPIDLTDEYIAAQFTMSHRVPLVKLVYHDSVLMTWRWNHTPNRWVKGAEYWDEWDLIHILYGGMPIFVVDSASVATKGERILKSYRDICGVLEKTAGSEMLEHRFLSEDRQVQQTRFANGWRVVVNFSRQTPYRDSDGATIAPLGFHVSQTQK